MEADYLSAQDLAKKFEYKSPTSINRIAKRWGIKHIQKGCTWFYNVNDFENAFNTLDFHHSSKFFDSIPVYDNFLISKCENAIVGADAHIPFLDIDFFDKILKFGEKIKAKAFYSVGDWYDQDAFSYWYKEVDRISWEKELDFSLKAVAKIQKIFPQSYFCMGSHDKRIARMLADRGKTISATFAYRELKNNNPNIQVTYHQKMILKSGDRTYHLEHPKTVMRLGTVTAHRRQNSMGDSLVFAHGHKQGLEKSWNGKDYVIALGMLGDPFKIHYHTIPSGYAEWDQGFLWINHGKPTLIFKDEISWWLKKEI